MSSTRTKRGARQGGFTLIELMITVAIVGILAAISLPMFATYVGKSRTVEATGFLQEVKARQESYRFDFGSYCDVSVNRANYFPTGIDPSDQTVAWPSVAGTNWDVLGAVPSGHASRFVYSTVASGPGGVNPTGKNFKTDRDYPLAGAGPADFWFITTAVGDLNDDCKGTDDDATNGSKLCNMIFESYSHTRGIYSSVGDGFE